MKVSLVTGTMTGQDSLLGWLADFLPYQLSVTSNVVSTAIAERYRERFGLRIAEWRVMAVVGDRGQATQRQLTDATIMDKVAINRACKVLEDRGLLMRLPNTRDGRSHILQLTVTGQAMHDEVMPLTRAIQEEMFEVLSEEEKEQLLALLKRLFNSADAMMPTAR